MTCKLPCTPLHPCTTTPYALPTRRFGRAPERSFCAMQGAQEQHPPRQQRSRSGEGLGKWRRTAHAPG